jgi:hypothetical protein
VHLTVSDLREAGDVLSEKARTSLKDFKGHFVLTVLRPTQPPLPLGARSLEGLVEAAFRQRLESGGYPIAERADAGAVSIEVGIESFHIDLTGGRWTFRFSYTASAAAGNGVATQSVAAAGERRRLMGRKEAEELLGEVFSDAVNQLDVAGLMKRAGGR